MTELFRKNRVSKSKKKYLIQYLTNMNFKKQKWRGQKEQEKKVR